MITLPYEDYFPADRDEQHFQRYKKLMLKLIERGHLEHQQFGPGSVEFHHILPKSFWTHDLGDEKIRDQVWCSKDQHSNVIGVTAHEHFILHLMLWKAFPNSWMPLAFKRMVESNQNGHKSRLSARQYDKLKKDAGISRSKDMRGRVWIHHEATDCYKIIHQEKLDTFLSLGWEKKSHRKGKFHTKETKDKISKSHKGKVLSTEHRQKLSESHSGQKAWNKGITPSEKTKSILSEKNKGKILSSSTRKKMGDSRTGRLHFRSSVYLCLDTQEIFYTLGQASEKTNAPSGGIKQVCQGKKLFVNGLSWKELESDDDLLVKKEIDNFSKYCLLCVETGEEFQSAQIALRKYGILNRILLTCLNGKTKTAGSFHWKIIERKTV